MQAPSRHPVLRPAAGFSMVEILVGMAIGMIGILVMMQVFSVAEGHKRTTTAGGDAQSNGAIALFSLDREIRQSGYGTSDLSILGCNLVLPTGVTLNAQAPLTINHAGIPAGDANTDTLLMVAGSSNGSPEGDGIVRQTSTNVYSVMTPTSFAVEDWVVAQAQTRPTTCSLRMEAVQAVNGTNPPDVTVRTGVTGMSNGRLFNLGRTPRVQAYAVRGGNLTVCDLLVNDCGNTARLNDETVWVPVAGGIVSLRAQYGRDTSGPPMDAVPDVYDQTAPGNACAWARVAAVRLALVVRSDQYEKTEVTTAAPSWNGGTDLPIDLSAETDWRHYRYKIFQTTVPIRNIVVLGARTAC